MEEWRERLDRIEALVEENAKMQKKNEEGFAELREYVYAVNGSVERIKKSRGRVAEQYFYNSLNATKTLGGVHFDYLKKNLKSSIPLGDGQTLDGEYDILMINGNSVGIVEVKSSVYKKNIDNLVNNQLISFKKLFPMYANYNFYLGIGGMSFDKQAEDAAKKLGVCILKLNGDAVEIYDKNLKVY
jgi:hypothetical protein